MRYVQQHPVALRFWGVLQRPLTLIDSAKVRRCQWEAYRDANWRCIRVLSRVLQNCYISNSKTFESVSVTASVTTIKSETTKVGICHPEPPPLTDMVTDLPYLITDRATDIPNDFCHSGEVPAMIRNYMSVTDNQLQIDEGQVCICNPIIKFPKQ